MRPLVFCALIVAFPVFAEETELKTATLPPGSYNVFKNWENSYATAGNSLMELASQFIGSFSRHEKATISLRAKSVEVNADGIAILNGGAQAELVIEGKTLMTFTSELLVLAPTRNGEQPIGHKEANAVYEQLDRAFGKRDQAAMAALFTQDAKTSVEEIDEKGAITSKQMNVTEFADYLCKLFPTASMTQPQNNGAFSMPKKDGSKTAANRTAEYIFNFPQGTLSYEVDQNAGIIRNGEGFLIESMSFKVPQKVQQNVAFKNLRNGVPRGRIIPAAQ